MNHNIQDKWDYRTTLMKSMY